MGDTGASLSLHERLIVALDVASATDALALVEKLGDAVSFYKVGFQLFVAGGPDVVRRLIDQGKRVFLDLKYFDVGKTVELAVRAAADLGASFVTVHGNKTVQEAAMRGVEGTPLQILIVTLLTSLDHEDVKELYGDSATIESMVRHRVETAQQFGIHGVIASGREVAQIRALARDDLLIVSPGIRQAGDARDDQKRTSTPEQAIRDGADYLVVGRPIRDAASPRAAAERISSKIAEGMRQRPAPPG